MTAHHIDGHLVHMTNIPTGPTARVPVPHGYEIRVTGHLAPRWHADFDGMTLTSQDDGTTAIQWPVADQSALHGLLRKLGDHGLTLVSVTPALAESDDTTHPS